MFDFFVIKTLWFYEAVIEYEWIFAIFYFASSLTAYSIFVYHETRFKDIDYYLGNVSDLYDFSRTRYKVYRAIFTAFLPLAMYIIVWSFVERFSSNKFLMRFG